MFANKLILFSAFIDQNLECGVLISILEKRS
jgi:hypothetical protein